MNLNYLISHWREEDFPDDPVYVRVILTIRNVGAERLADAVDLLEEGFDLLWAMESMQVFKGYDKELEISRNLFLPENQKYQPHFHLVLVADRKDACKCKTVVSEKKLSALWRDVLDVDYDPVVYIQVVEGA